MKTTLVNESLDSFLSEEVKKKVEKKAEKKEPISFGPGPIESYKRLYAEWKDVNRKLDRFYNKPSSDPYKRKEQKELEQKLRKLEQKQAEIEKRFKLNLKANYEDAKRFKRLVGASDLCTVHFD